MAKSVKIISLSSIFFLLSIFLLAEEDIVIKSRLFIGTKPALEPKASGPEVVISSYTQPIIIPAQPSQIEEESRSITYLQNELGTIYQLQSVDHLTSSGMLWTGRKKRLVETILLDEFVLPIHLSPEVISKNNVRLRVEVSRYKGSEVALTSKSFALVKTEKGRVGVAEGPGKIEVSYGEGEKLLDTEIMMNFNEQVVLGFPSNGTPYFLSLLVTKKKKGDESERVISRGETEVEILNPPDPIYKVTPAYPEECKKEGIEGEVILKVSTDKKGEVEDVEVLRSVHPDLDRAAVAALQQWKYKPVIKDKKPVPVVFAVKVNFKLREPSVGQSSEPPSIDQSSASPSTDEEKLKIILAKCAEYCEKLAGVSLDFVCNEKITEELYQQVFVSTVSGGQSQVSFSASGTRLAEKNIYVYDYQMVRKAKELRERRNLVEENGKRKEEKDAELKTLVFRHKNIIFGPIGVLSKHWQQYHDYRLLKDDTLEGEKTYVIEAVPKPGYKLGHLSGKIWVRKSDYSILKVEWSQQGIENYDKIEALAKSLKAEPRLTLVSEYGFEKNGIRFPSRYSIDETYLRRGRKYVVSKTNVVYKDYKFFTVDTEVKY